MIGFPRLAGLMLGEYASATGVHARRPGYRPWIRRWRRGCVPRTCACRAIWIRWRWSPAGRRCGDETRAILQAMRGRPFIFNLGHGIVPQTPPEHVAGLVGLVRAG